ncbi:MAG: M20 family metallo-hydrolase [Sphingobacteriaceae bacterium]|nr:M20 family metallo-hydrolase [Sphingobacteriaceae bacterium]
MTETLAEESIELLKRLISIPSFSREEDKTADAIELFFTEHGLSPRRSRNNIWSVNKYYDASKPTILLNSHHDTVKPNPGYTRDPFSADIEDGKLYGLGSNDAGGCLVSLIATFRHFNNQQNLKYNLCIAATAEEEISGKNGIESIVPELGPLDFAIVGEPTLMDLATSERGLMVLDCVSQGKAGHAAREEGDNAIYKALKDIEWFRTFKFPRESESFGPIKMSVTVINAGTQHNVVPAKCEFVVDVRVTDAYRNEEVIEIIRQYVNCDITPRSTRLKPSYITKDHPLVQAGLALGKKTYGSSTSSDQALLDCTSVKIGPGDSARSHMADEFIYLEEIHKGIELYIALLEKIIK